MAEQGNRENDQYDENINIYISQDDLTADEDAQPYNIRKPDPVYYVITKGRTSSDIGIYKTWAEVQPRIHGISGATHKKFYTMEEAEHFLEQGRNTMEPEEQTYAKTTTENKDTRQLRQKTRPDYRNLNGNKSQKAQENPNKTPIIEINHKRDDEVEEALSQRDEALSIMDKAQKALEKAIEDNQKDKEKIKNLMTENKNLTTAREKTKTLMEENSNLKDEITRMTTKITEYENRIQQLENKLTNKEPTREPARITDNQIQREHITRVNFIADSNRKVITENLRRLLPECEIIEDREVYHTTDLKTKMESNNIPAADITVILMGTNDIRTGRGDQAAKNLRTISQKSNQNKTIVTHIPPIEIHRGEDEYEDMQLERAKLNRIISINFKHHVKMSDITKEHNINTVLKEDGFHWKQQGRTANCTGNDRENQTDNIRNRNKTTHNR